MSADGERGETVGLMRAGSIAEPVQVNPRRRITLPSGEAGTPWNSAHHVPLAVWRRWPAKSAGVLPTAETIDSPVARPSESGTAPVLDFFGR